LLRSRKTTVNTLDWIESDYRLAVLAHRVEMRPVMRRADFGEHPDDDSEESRNLRHRPLANLCGAFRDGLTITNEPRQDDDTARALGASAPFVG